MRISGGGGITIIIMSANIDGLATKIHRTPPLPQPKAINNDCSLTNYLNDCLNDYFTMICESRTDCIAINKLGPLSSIILLEFFYWTTYKLSIICQNVKILDLCLRNDPRSPLFYEHVQLRRRLLSCTFLPVSKHYQNLFSFQSFAMIPKTLSQNNAIRAIPLYKIIRRRKGESLH